MPLFVTRRPLAIKTGRRYACLYARAVTLVRYKMGYPVNHGNVEAIIGRPIAAQLMKKFARSHSMPYCSTPTAPCSIFHAAVSRHHAAAGPDAALFSEVWRQKQIEYTWTHTLAGRYSKFWTLTQRALDYCFERFPSGRPQAP